MTCPILFGNAIEVYDLTESEISRFCREGCCPNCSDILDKKYFKRKRNRQLIVKYDPAKDLEIMRDCLHSLGDVV